MLPKLDFKKQLPLTFKEKRMKTDYGEAIKQEKQKQADTTSIKNRKV